MADGYVDESGRVRWSDESELAELTLEGSDCDEDEPEDEEEDEDFERVSEAAMAGPRAAGAPTGR